MKKLIYIIALLALVISCQKEIDVDLNEANPQIVIEANYTAEDSTVHVLITKTSNYFDLSTAPEINNAVVVITDHTGATQTIPSIGNGQYELANYIPLFNTTYTLSVNVDGVTYDAECDLMAPVPLEELTLEYINFFGAEGYSVDLRFQDPADTVNHYLIQYSKNGELRSELADWYFADDVLTDGNLYERPLFLFEEAPNPNDPPILPNTGDSIGFEMMSVDAEVYDYYSQAVSILGSGQASAAPANPESNWSNKALGYFSAYSISRRGVVIP